MSNYVIILAAGDGKRLGLKIPKCFIQFKKKLIYQYSLESFCSFNEIGKIVLVVPKQYVEQVEINDKRVIVVAGGSDRNKSFECGLQALGQLKNNDKIIVHDAARIYIQEIDIQTILLSKLDYGTLCYIGPRNNSDLRLDKYNVQTPQFFKYFIYKQVNQFNKNGKDLFTYLNLKYSSKNFIISSNRDENKKITFKKDLL